jgi:hypothetical protein
MLGGGRFMGRWLWRTALAVAVASVGATPAAGQIDYRNLDDDRPVHVEDAYPVERYAFELLIPYTYEREQGGGWRHHSVVELAYGIVRNAHVAVKLPLAGVREGADTDWGLAGVRALVLYNFNTEGPWLPALSLRADLDLPVGSLAADEASVSVKGILTRSWGRSRLHLNGAYRFGPEGAPAAVEAAHQWWYGAALDRTLFRQSLLLVGEVYVARPADGVPVEVNASLGVRWQWRPTTVVDLGVTRGLRADYGPEVGVTVGLSHAFAVAGLLPRLR